MGKDRNRRGKSAIVPVILVAVTALGTGLFLFTRSRTADQMGSLEMTLAEEECSLLPLSLDVPKGISTIRYSLDDDVPASGFYLRNPASRRGTLLRAVEGGLGPGDLHVYPSMILQQVSSNGPVRVLAENEGWELFQVVPQGSEPSVSQARVHEFEMADGFMRTNLAHDDGWHVINGEWKLKKHGGGIPKTAEQAIDDTFQRAANPFTVLGRSRNDENAVLIYDTKSSKGESYFVEGRFLMGPPEAKRAKRHDKNRVPSWHFLVAQGNLDGPQLGFGWWPDDSGSSCWRMCFRRGQGDWRILESWPTRPPLRTWSRVGVGASQGHRAFALLDGEKLGCVKLSVIVSGPLHIHVRGDGSMVEFDDIKAAPFFSRGEDLGTPVFVPSRNFSNKKGSSTRDPVQFDQWARGMNAYKVSGHSAVTQMRLFSDFTYRSSPTLPEGVYKFELLKENVPAGVDTRESIELAFRKTAEGWEIPRGKGTKPAFSLELGRRGSSVVIRDDGEWRPIGQCTDPVSLKVSQPSGSPFRPEDHHLLSTRTWHELFEKAPSDWYWHDGSFGMNLRWACQPGWNFMAGESPYLCSLFSKHSYIGDQEIDCYMALPGIISRDRGYYIRRDLCISFCSDGRNLDSGYALLFGASNNTRTILMKKGRIIAATEDPEFLFPVRKGKKADYINDVHWFWWNFRIRKTQRKIVVVLNGKDMFEVYDPKPISDGHLAFWTIRNGIVLSRVTVAAENRILESHVEDVPLSGESLPWHGLFDGGVVMSESGGMTEVRNQSGGGSFAVRTSCEVDLSKTPILDIPFRADKQAKVNLHIGVKKRPFLAMVTAPITETPFLLSGSGVGDKDFDVPRLTSDELSRLYLGAARLMNDRIVLDLGDALERKGVQIKDASDVVLTIGNTSNEKYLMAGFAGNRAGTRYWVGRPRWLASLPAR